MTIQMGHSRPTISTKSVMSTTHISNHMHIKKSILEQQDIVTQSPQQQMMGTMRAKSRQ